MQINQHVYAIRKFHQHAFFSRYSPSRTVCTMILRGKILEIRNDELMIEFEGNDNNQWDQEQRIISSYDLLKTSDKEIWIEEIHGRYENQLGIVVEELPDPCGTYRTNS